MAKKTRKYGINLLDYHHYCPIVGFDSLREQKENLKYVDDSEVIEGNGVTAKDGEVSAPVIYGTFSSNRIQKEALGLKDDFEIIEGGGVQSDDEPQTEDNILTFTANNAGSTIKLQANGSPDPVSLSTSTDRGKTWSNYIIGHTIVLAKEGDSVKFKATTTNTSFNGSSNDCYRFEMTGSINASGDVTSLLNGIGGDEALPTIGCFSTLFRNCTALVTAPNLPSTTLQQACYHGMFQGCTSLTTAPELPATTLADNCYQYMFDGCTSLERAQTILSATTLKQCCYLAMFRNCTSLTTAPILPAEYLVYKCYVAMFCFCSRLNYIKAMFRTLNNYTHTDSWVKEVAASGTFVKNSSATWDYTGISAIPSGWTVETASE